MKFIYICILVNYLSKYFFFFLDTQVYSYARLKLSISFELVKLTRQIFQGSAQSKFAPPKP